MNPVKLLATFATHGMAVFGNGSLYFSHLPMFHAPHDYQAVFSGSFDQTGLSAYLDPTSNPSHTFYTMAPQPFDLLKLVSEMDNGEVKKTAKLFTGVFDEGGTAITPSFTVDFEEIIYFKKLNPSDPHPSHPIFIVFGNPDREIFMTHVIHSPPDFDQILKVTSLVPGLSDSLRKNGILQVPIDEINGDQPLVPNQTVSGLSVGSQIYFNSEDLAN